VYFLPPISYGQALALPQFHAPNEGEFMAVLHVAIAEILLEQRGMAAIETMQ
jgi:hypothetical protein